MDFKSKRFWVAQALELIITIAMFMQIIDFETWMAKTMIIEGGWFTLDTAGKFAKKKE